MSWTKRVKVTEKMVERVEASQARYTAYNVRLGKPLLYILPLFLVGLTIISLLNIFNAMVLLYVFVAVLLVFAINTLMLGFAATKTKRAFTKRLQLERQKGRPLDSLRGFVSIKRNIDATIFTLKLLFVISILVLIIYLVYVGMIFTNADVNLAQWVAYGGLGLALVCFGGALLVQSVQMDITSVTGLSDFYRPSAHELFVDNYFGDVFQGHLDPIVYLKWDEFTEEVRKSLKPEFIHAILTEEPDEIPVKFAIEKLLYLHYLEYSGVLDHQEVLRELEEFLDLNTGFYHPDQGVKIGGRRYFHWNDIFKIFDLIESYSPAFFDIVDRLQLELMDNITIVAEDPVYMDVSASEVCRKDDECNLFLLIYNNAPDTKDYIVRIVSPGFEPNELKLKVPVEGRGNFEIPKKPIALTDESDEEVVYILATMIKNADSLWVTFEPRDIGIQTVQVFLEDAEGRIIEGKTMAIDIVRNIAYLLKRLTSFGSMAGGAASPLLRLFGVDF